ncbi:MAG: hypothetical protein E7J94_20815 [Clostridium sp.]|nr:hypothetical protein [Clostridium sp.]
MTKLVCHDNRKSTVLRTRLRSKKIRNPWEITDSYTTTASVSFRL